MGLSKIRYVAREAALVHDMGGRAGADITGGGVWTPDPPWHFREEEEKGGQKQVK